MAIFRKMVLAPIALLSVGVLIAGCAGDPGTSGGETPEPGDTGGTTETQETITLTLANSFTDDHPHSRCGAYVIAEEINALDIGLQIDVFTNSALGGDVDRITSLIAGDIDMDIQGSSGLATVYPAIGVMDAAYAFTGADHLFEFFDSGAADQLQSDLVEGTGLRPLTLYFFGMRNFSANEPIRTPEDLQGLRMRFPGTPAYLANAEALGAEAVAVAFEEIFLALQQGLADGQENPIPTVRSMSLDEVQSHVSLSGHQTGFQFVVINEDRWQSLNSEQQEALSRVAANSRNLNRDCIDAVQQEIIDDWTATGQVTVVDDVDRDAFRTKADLYWEANFTGAELDLYRTIRDSAPAS